MTLEREELHADWTARLSVDGASGFPVGAPDSVRDRRFAATVPGQIHTDLLREGVIADPLFDRNEAAARWVGQADWEYRRHVDIDPRGYERVDLVTDGLDTVATISLDGVQIGSTRNMHRRYRFDLRDQTNGSNARRERELELLFESPYREATQFAARFGTMPGPYTEPFPYVRKMASSFGWDWGPACVTSGPWRPIAIERWSTARLRDIRPLTDVEAGEGVLDAHIRLERSGPSPDGSNTADLDHDGEDDDLVLVVTVSGHDTKQRSRVTVTPREDETVVTVRIPDARLWWPHGYGEQALYDVDVRLETVDGDVLDQRSFPTGFRSTRVDIDKDETGRPFTAYVNGVAIDVRGVNWIPDDVIVSRVTREQYEERLEQAVACNANFVRVWGGGVYESHDFYEVCDRLGLLVWQDFAFACSAYPEQEPIRSEVIAEARDNVARLSRHPSLIVWNGSNENVWMHDSNGWAEELGDRGWGFEYYIDLLPTIVDAEDPSRFYTVSSPWSGDERLEPNNVDYETHHSWEVWNQLGDDRYRDSVPRFVSEFGWQSPPQWRTMREAVSDEPMTPSSPGVAHHQKAFDGAGKLARGLVPRFARTVDDVPADYDRWHFLTQLQQTRAIATAVEHWRTHWPHNTGVVLWQLNDLWPVASWSVIDGAGRPKPLAHELGRLYGDVLLALRPVVDGEDANVAPFEVAVRSSRGGLSDEVRLRRVDMDGSVLAQASLPVELDSAGVAVVAVPAEVGRVADPAGELVIADMGDERAVWTPAPDREMRWQPARYRAEFRPTRHGIDVAIESDSLIRDLLMQPDRVSSRGSVDRGFMTLLPGEHERFRIEGVTEDDIPALSAPPVMWSLNAVLRGEQDDARGRTVVEATEEI